MSETDSDMQEKRVKVSRLAIVSLLLSIFGGCLLMRILYGFIGHPRIPFYLRRFYVYGHFVSGLMIIAGIMAGIVAIKKIRNKHGILKGKGFAISGVAVSIVFLFIWIWHNPVGPFTARKRCAANMRSLAISMLIYTTGDYAMPADNWCDLLVEGGYVESEKQLRCPADKKGTCSYAINPNHKQTSPSDSVLLFECQDGWNRSGGAELLSADNHDGKGCNIIFNDYHVEFIKKEEFKSLKWGQ